MSFKLWRITKEVYDYSSSQTCNLDTLTNTEAILIWFDASITKEDPTDQYSIEQLHLSINSLAIFIDEQACLKFINQFEAKNKLLLIVSGSLGQSFIPKIEHLSQINFIYVFCGRKSYHEYWATKHEKVRGVYDVITDLCDNLNRDKQNLEIDEKTINILTTQSSSLAKFENLIHDSNQAKDDYIIPITSADIPFARTEIYLPEIEIESSDNICASETVTPIVQYKQQMEFSDTGIWPCVFMIGARRNEIFNCLHFAIGIIQYSDSIENCLDHIRNHNEDPHFIILHNPTNIPQLITLIHPHIVKVYIYCSNDRINEYDAFGRKYPTIVSVLKHIGSLTKLTLSDLASCIVDIGKRYDFKKKKRLAQARYRYAYRLHLTIQEFLNNQIEIMVALNRENSMIQ
ncbi:unnamed protein product [Adineta steineri]|uniref:Uncharacterized protein n=1 Tax=Adineta steineri TaxID=433720 RepID=A0A819NJW5_9BILA|nr:unnamed protein product [Adineta steineri]CAF3997423.1 unnamed protein product [Adineta steineri]